MALKKWKKISSKEIHKNPWWTYQLDEFELPNGKRGHYHIVNSGDSVVIIPILNNKKILTLKQYRYVNDFFSIEFPAGGVEKDSIEKAAKKELIEEAGKEGDLKKIGEFLPYNSRSNEITHVFIANNLTDSNSLDKDETEEFEYLELTPTEIDQYIAKGLITDGLSLGAWIIAKTKLGNLFSAK